MFCFKGIAAWLALSRKQASHIFLRKRKRRPRCANLEGKEGRGQMGSRAKRRRESDSQQDTESGAKEGKAGRLSTSFDNFRSTFSAEISIEWSKYYLTMPAYSNTSCFLASIGAWKLQPIRRARRATVRCAWRRLECGSRHYEGQQVGAKAELRNHQPASHRSKNVQQHLPTGP